MNRPYAIQGFEGSFHQKAARKFLGDECNVLFCSTFREVVKSAQNPDLTSGAVMAIENSIAGTILPNYQLLINSNLKIVGEVYLSIDQNLLVNPGVKLEDIQEVHSHPMALLQCSNFLEKHPWKLIETEDTALSAKHIHQNKSKNIAAIAGKLAAELFRLDIIRPNIQTQPNNYTRFWILEPGNVKNSLPHADKASIIFETDHSKGSLARVLGKISQWDINLSKLQSMPIPGSDWKYAFHADCEFVKPGHFYNALEEIKPLTAGVQVYGIYKNGKNA